MNYAEAAYFDGNHCQHVADRDEHRRLQRISEQARRYGRDRRYGGRSK